MIEENPYVSLIPPQYASAILRLHSKFESKSIQWALFGNLAEALGSVRVEPDCIEIVTSKEGAEQMNREVAEFNPNPVSLCIQQLPRDAVDNGVEFPVYVRSYSFEFNVDSVLVKVHADLQYKLGDWEWGDKFEFEPRTVYIVNKPTLVEPITVQCEIYQALGWTDRMDKIRWVIETRKKTHRSFRR